MITFRVNFLLSFPLIKPNTGKQKTVKEKKKDTKNKKTKFINESEEPNITTRFGPEQLVGVAHVEYELVPGRVKYDFDVACWKSIGIVLTHDGQCIVRTVIKNNKAWIPITLEHYIDKLSTVEEVKKLRNHVVEFKVNHVTPKGVNQMQLSIKSETLEENDTFKILEQVTADESPDYDQCSISNYIAGLIKRWASYPHHTDVGSLLTLRHYCNYEEFYDIIDKDANGMAVRCREFAPPPPDPNTKWEPVPEKFEAKTKKAKAPKEGKKSTKEGSGSTKKSKQIRADSTSIQVPAEIFFTDPVRVIYKSKTPTYIIDDVYVLLSAENLMTRAQKLTLNPLVVKVQKLRNLPVEDLRKSGFHSVYTKYFIPSIAYCQSVQKPLEENVVFDEAHIYFTDKRSMNHLIEFMETRRLLVEIYGIRDVKPKETKYSLFGLEPDDCRISTIKRTTVRKTYVPTDDHNANVLLAVSSYDLSSLTLNMWDFRERAQCHEPNVLTCQPNKGYFDPLVYPDTLTTLDIIFPPVDNKKIKRFVEESEMIKRNTTLQLEAYILAPQAPCLVLHQPKNRFYRRIFMVITDEQTAMDVYIDVCLHNDRVKNEMKESNHTIYAEYSEMITGFLVDNGNNFAIFIEGVDAGYITSIYHHMLEVPWRKAEKIFNNTNYGFEKRLYQHFIDEGVHVIVLKLPLQDIMAKKEVYVSGKMPNSCFRALQKLDMMFRSREFRTILQLNILPKPEELLSLNLQFGVSMRWKEEVKRVEEGSLVEI